MDGNKKKLNEDKKAKFIMSGLTIVMMTTLVIYYIGAIITKKYLISFSIDSIVGVLAFAILIKNLSIKYKLLEEFNNKKEFILLDVVSIVLCLMTKISFKLPFDVSLPILVISYFISKKKFEKILKKGF